MTKNKKSKAPQIITLLKKYYPDANCALHHNSPFQLLIATILSAQCTDDRVNMVTPELFKKFPNPEKLGKADQSEIEKIIRSTGFFKNKAHNIIQTSRILFEKYGNTKFPKTIEDLIVLPGVGRKTANVVLGNAFGIASGIVVDTHVTRLSNRLGWVKSENAVSIENELVKIIPKEDWILISHLLIFHGRQVCKARKPMCDKCFLSEDCPKKGV